MGIKTITDLLPPEAWAAYIIGFTAIGVGFWQWKSTFRQSKKLQIFEELAADITQAREKLDGIGTDYEELISDLANAANEFSATEISPHNEEEIKKRISALNKLELKHKQLVVSIHGSFKEVLVLIKKVEKSTLLSEKSKRACRMFYYEVNEQYELQRAANDVLTTFNVVPNLGEKPNITSDTFNNFATLNRLINQRNTKLSNYIDDLETIIHNDLVAPTFGRAKPSNSPQHLSHKGITDNRANESLI